MIATQNNQNQIFFVRRLLARSSDDLWINSTAVLPRPAVFTGSSREIPIAGLRSASPCTSPAATPFVPSIASGSMLASRDRSGTSTGTDGGLALTGGGGGGGLVEEAAGGEDISTTCWQWGQRTWPDAVV